MPKWSDGQFWKLEIASAYDTAYRRSPGQNTPQLTAAALHMFACCYSNTQMRRRLQRGNFVLFFSPSFTPTGSLPA